MKRAWMALGGLAALAAVSAVGATSCSQAATNVAVRTFERAQRVDVVCLKVFDPYPVPILAQPAPTSTCARVAPGADGTVLPYHLYALVTQSARGEVAVVDLTQGIVVDTDHSTPGINFIPVGALPTDVAVAPAGDIAFIGAAEVNKPALYAINTRDILGDSQGLPASTVPPPPPPPTLPSLPVCSLPHAPSTVSIVPHGDTYEIAVVLPGDNRSSAKVVTLDPAPFRRAAGIDTSAGSTYAPGALQPCVFTGSVELAGTVPAPSAAAAWPDGVPYADAGPEPAPVGVGCSATDAGADAAADVDAGDSGAGDSGAGDSGAGDSGAGDSGAEAGADADAGAGGDAGADSGQDAASGWEALQGRPHATVGARDGTFLYVGDDGVPVVHVLDLTHVGAPVERAPLVATSVLEPSRRVQIGDIAVSSATSDYRKYLYAVDKKEGSILVYDVSAPSDAARAPLLRPHPELNPFQPPDRLRFGAPVAAVSFVRHDFPLTQLCDPAQTPLAAGRSGLLCNPNPNAIASDGSPVPTDLGYGICYRANANTPTGVVPAFATSRLRGVFGMVTLSTGQVVTIDVDDWDGPCRRPDPMCAEGGCSAITPGEPAPTSSSDLDPYHATTAYQSGQSGSPVSLEAFFPVSAPHRARSFYLLRNDPTSGNHVPNLNGVPTITGAQGALPSAASGDSPLLQPTKQTLADPSMYTNPTEPDPAQRNKVTPDPQQAGIRFAWEDPEVHVDQDWTVTYEGTLPAFDGTSLATPITTTDDYRTVTLSNHSALFCRKGIEDWRVGKARAVAVKAEMKTQQIAAPVGPAPGSDLELRVADYVQLTEGILDAGDPYWQEDSDCWTGSLATNKGARRDACFATYGDPVDQNINRDFPILEAYDDRLVLGTYYTPPAPSATAATPLRTVVGADARNQEILKQMKCCFHHQVQFKVRTGGVWSAVGTASGFLHRVAADSSGACVLSCEPREALLNSRAPAVPRTSGLLQIERSSALALRNPFFSFVVWDGRDASTSEDRIPQRDLQWKFTTRGQFTPLIVNIASTSTAVAPQSMHFIDSISQLAVVDGSSQGLVLVDLDTVALAHTPFF